MRERDENENLFDSQTKKCWVYCNDKRTRTI